MWYRAQRNKSQREMNGTEDLLTMTQAYVIGCLGPLDYQWPIQLNINTPFGIT